MKKLVLLLFTSLFLGCSKDPQKLKQGSFSENFRERSPWVSSGLSLDAKGAERNRLGIETLVSSEDFLFARNDRRLNGERNYQLFFGKAGSLLWKELELPDGDIPGSLFADSTGLYVGSFRSRFGGRLWHFDPQKEIWNLIPISVVDKMFPVTDSSYGIDGIARFNGLFVLSFSHSVAWDRESDLESVYNPVYFQQKDSSWRNYNKGFPAAESFLRAKEWNGSLYALTYGNSIYRFDVNDSIWHKIKGPNVVCSNGIWNERSSLSRDALPYKGDLFIGFANLEGMFSLSPQGIWSQKTKCSLKFESADENSSFSLQSTNPPSVYKFVQKGEDLIALGEASAVYSGAKDRWLSLPPIPGVREIFDGALVRDTLYVAAYQKGILKMPISFIDSLLQTTIEVKQ